MGKSLGTTGLTHLWSKIEAALGLKENKVTIVNHGTSDTTFALTPNILHVWGTINSLTLSLVTDSDNYVDGYWFKFTAGSSFTALTLPSGVSWVAEPDIKSGKTYDVMISDNLASYLTDGMDNLYATKTWVSNNIKTINNTAVYGQGNISVSPITNIVASSGSTLTAAVDTIYTYSSAVTTLAVTLPAMTDTTIAKALSLILTTGTSPNVTFNSADSTTILYYENFELEDDTMYEINAMFAGSYWIIGKCAIATS